MAERPPSPPPSPTGTNSRSCGSIYITATEPGSGKALVSLGIIDLVLRKSAKVCFFRPIIHRVVEGDLESKDHDEDITLVLEHYKLEQTFEESYGLRTDKANALLGQNRKDDLIDIIISKYKDLEAKCDFVVCEGSDYLSKGQSVEFNLNQEIAKNLGCPILVLGSAHDRSIPETVRAIQIAIDGYRAYEAEVVGIVLNKAAIDEVAPLKQELKQLYGEAGYSLIVLFQMTRV
jgi:phosphate acetyltransferase